MSYFVIRPLSWHLEHDSMSGQIPSTSSPSNSKPMKTRWRTFNFGKRCKMYSHLMIPSISTMLLPTVREKLTLVSAYYSKSQIFVQKFNFDKTKTFSRDFHPKKKSTIFFVKSKLSTAKKSKTTTFSRVFHPKKSTIFSENQS